MARDVYVHASVPDSPALRHQVIRLVMRPGDVACGRTGAWLHGAWTPPPATTLPLETTRALDASGRQPESLARRRLTMSEIGLEPDVMDLDGLLVLTPRRICFDLMRERSLVEAVVVADAFANAGAINLDEFYDYVDVHRRWPGVRLARHAVLLASPDALSPGESRLRMIVVLAGFPHPLVNSPFFAGDPPVLLAHPDLLLHEVPRPAGLEFDGAIHNDPGNQAIDRRRANRLVAAGGLPGLRYDGEAVAVRRELIVVECAGLTRYPQRLLLPLRPADFRRPGPRLRW